MRIFALLIATLLIGASCQKPVEKPKTSEKPKAVGSDQVDKPVSESPIETVNREASKDADVTENPEKMKRPKLDKSATTQCLDVNTGDRFLLKKQTFPINFKPFENSCFVTTYDPEYEDPPLGSEISIYKDGRQIYKFDSRYNPNAATCWVKSVGFEDVNADELTDIIVTGKCGAKSGDIQGNEVFINDGKGFYTNVSANDKLENYKKIKDIADFARKNQQLFTRE